MNTINIDQNYSYFEKNRSQLLKKYEDEFLVIVNKSVVGNFKSEEKAINYAMENFKLGNFLIKQCLPKKEEQTQVFHSRVIF